MLTDVQIINLGLSKISASRIRQIAPAVTPLETFMAVNYPQWKRVELARRRWVFALVDDYVLTLSETLIADVSQKYKYLLPNDCLRPVRNKDTEWKQRGRYVYSAHATLKISYIRNAAESEFDPLFNEVLACKISFESAEFVTQSTTKKESARKDYDTAVDNAGAANAFVIGPETIGEDDSNFEWLSVRYCGS